MKKSLKTQLILLFSFVLILVFGSCLLANSFLLEKYYLNHSRHKLISIYDCVNTAVQNGTIDDEQFQLEIQRECEAANVTTVLLYNGEEYSFSSNGNNGFMKDRLFRYNIEVWDGSDPSNGENTPKDPPEDPMSFGDISILDKSDNYTIVRFQDPNVNTGYLEMWGTTDSALTSSEENESASSGEFFMRLPLESIARSAQLANRFMLLVSLAGIGVGIVFLILLLRSALRPVKELTELSEQMANLDFNARYTGGGSREIRVLGDNFNRMSASLEMAMTDLKSANLTLQKDLELKDQREERRSEFLSNVSHELKTPLAVIEGYAEGLQTPLGDNSEKREQYTQIILDEVHRMNSMLKNLLSLSELENSDISMTRFNLTSLISGIILQNDILAKQAEIEMEFSENEPDFVWGDQFCIEQVVQNYISNAIRYAEGEHKKIRVFYERDTDNIIRTCVYNTGNPISAEEMSRIWEKFYKIDKVRSRSKGGNGIGLSIVKTIMDHHGMAYGVRNEEDGITFWFELKEN